jgi:uncharacterized protein YpmS
LLQEADGTYVEVLDFLLLALALVLLWLVVVVVRLWHEARAQFIRQHQQRQRRRGRWTANVTPTEQHTDETLSRHVPCRKHRQQVMCESGRHEED